MIEDNDVLRTKAAESWRNLVDYYRGFPNKDVAPDSSETRNWATHERCLIECFAGVLPVILGRLQSYGLSIGCGIVHINSPLARRRLKLPIWGYTNDGHRNAWTEHVNQSDSRGLMFRQPTTPRHLLTELMWRLQEKTKLGMGFPLALFLTSNDPLYSAALEQGVALACSNMPIESFRDATLEWRNGLVEKTAFQILGIDDDQLNKRFWQPLNERYNAVRENVAFPLDDFQYSGIVDDDRTNSLIVPALQALQAMGRVKFDPDEVPTNVFYLCDVIETEEVGGIDFQVVLQKDRNPKADELRGFLREAQWLFSQYVIHPLVSAERNHALAGDTYRKTHFSRTPGSSTDGLDDLVNRLVDAKAAVGDDKAKKVIDIVLTHFRTAGSASIGTYWRGYSRHAFETACTVAAVIDELFPELKPTQEGKKLNHADIVRRCGSNFEGLLSSPVNGMVLQLLRGLAAEKELFMTPFYREHFVHSFHCFAMGLVLLAWSNVTVLPSIMISQFTTAEPLQLLKKWFLVSMWHDVAYSLQKGHELLEGFVTEFMDFNKRGKRCRGLIPWRPSLGHLLQAKEMFDPLREVACSAFHVSNTLVSLGIGADDIALASALDRADHGIWSALFFGHVCDSAWLSKDHGIEVKDIMRAILVHHLPDWNLKSVLSDFDLNESILRESTHNAELTVSKFQDQVGKGDEDHVCVYRDKNPLGFLLFLSDMLSQPGREAPEMGGRVPSRIGIHLDGLHPGKARDPNEDGALIIRLRYDAFPMSKDDMRSKFFGNPAKFFKLKCDPLADNAVANFLCVQLLKGEETNSNIWICFGGGKERSGQ